MANVRAWYEGLLRRRVPIAAGATGAAFTAAAPDEAQAGTVFRAPAVRIGDKVIEAARTETHWHAMLKAAQELGFPPEQIDELFSQNKLQAGFVTNTGNFIDAETVARNFPKTFGESGSMRRGGLLGTVATGAGALGQFGTGIAEGLGIPTTKEQVKGLASTVLGTIFGIPGVWDTHTQAVGDMAALGEAVLTQPAETAGAIAGGVKQAFKENPARAAGGATGIALGSIIPMRPPAFIKGKRLPAVLSWPAEVARQAASPAEFTAKLNEPVRKMEGLLRNAPMGMPIGRVSDFVANPDLRAHLPWGVLEQPVVLDRAPAAFILGAPMLIGKMNVAKNLLDASSTRAGAPYYFPELVPRTPEGIFKYVIGEELLHLSRAATPGKATKRTNMAISGHDTPPVPGRLMSGPGGSRQQANALKYYTQDPAEQSAGIALGYLPTRTKRPEFSDFLLPTEDTFKRYGYSSMEDFWQQANSPGFKQPPASLRRYRLTVEAQARKALMPKPEAIAPPGATGPRIVPLMDWLREHGKSF